MAQAFFGGVHPNDMKAATNEKAIEQLAAPAEVVIPMSMHIGAPCKPIVAVGDKVKIGQRIGEPGGFVSAPIHASISGTVKAVEPRPFSMGGKMMSVVIENDFQNEISEEVKPVADPDSLTPEQLVEIVKNAGIVGQGGATFPTHVKISSGLGKVDYVIINAAECEPYITGDHRTCLERPEQVIKGATLLAKCFGVDKVYIGIEANKQNAADVLNAKIAELNAPVVVEVLHTRYPQGAEKQLVQAVSGRQVPSGKLPADAGCCIFNLNTTCAIYRAVYEGLPVVNKIVTVSGSGVIDPKNIECPIGTPITKLFDACGGLKDETYKLIMGGPMMGLAQYDVDVTVGKGTGAMLAFADKEEQYVEDPQCIRCGKCVGVCPIRLEPVFMYKYLMKGDVDTWQNVLHGMDCIECGACTYTCPARLPLTHAFRLGKQEVNNARMAAKAKAEAEAKAAAEKKEAYTMTDYKNLKLIASSSPHIRSNEDTRSIMLDVIIALLPALAWSVYCFGWKALLLTAVSVVSCVFFEWAYRKLMKKSCMVGDLSAVVTGILLSFVCPVDLPWWVIIIGAFFSIVVVKQLYGGIGCNFLNPALAGRAFLLASYATWMTSWAIPQIRPDVTSAATPMAIMKEGTEEAFTTLMSNYSIGDMFLGKVGGSLGEVSALCLLVGGVYLLIRKVISWQIPVAYIGTVAILTLIAAPAGIDNVQYMLYNVFGGGLMLGAIFMATDYATSPVTKPGQLIFGLGCGLLTCFIRRFGSYPEGVCYSILIMNCTTWLLDKYIRPTIYGAVKKEKKEAAK